jgi:multidrug resistance efflux pump
MPEQTQVSQESGRPAPTVADLVDRLSRFDGPPEAFLANLLAVQCYIAAAGGGAILRMAGQGQVEALAIHPPIAEGGRAPQWLAQAVEHGPGVLASGTTAVKPVRAPDDLYGAPARMFLLLVPIRGSNSVRGVACYLIETADEATLAICRERLELTVGLLSLYEMRLTLQRRQLDMARLRMAMDVLGAVNEHDRFAGAGMAFCNELAARLQCERVGLGFLKGRYVHLKALSHTEKFTRKMKLVQDVESAMEECLDQDVEVVYPASPEATYVSRSTKSLALTHGPSAVVSLPLRRAGESIGTAILERPVDKPFTLEEVESLRLAADLCTPRLANLHETDRWVGGRMAASIRKGAAFAVGNKHTWIKLLVIGLFGLILFVTFYKGDNNAEGSFQFEATVQQALVAPFEGKIESVTVKPDDLVKKGDVLVTLETQDLKDKLRKAHTDLDGSVVDASNALAKSHDDRSKLADYKIALSQQEKAKAEIALLEQEINDASIKSPIDGKVVSEKDWTREYRPYVKVGDVIFEVAPVDKMRAMIDVPEGEIAEVAVGNVGELATEGYPDKTIHFKVDRIYPVAAQADQTNVFKVEVTLDPTDIKTYGGFRWISPGVKGQAKIFLDKRPLCQIWTQKLVNWVRMKLWLWF